MEEKLEPLMRILPSIAAGDFSNRLDIPEEDDEFTMLFMGINYLQTELSMRFAEEGTKDIQCTDAAKEDGHCQEKCHHKPCKKYDDLYKTMIESSDDMIFTVDLQGNFIYFNNALERHLGYSKGEIKNINGFDLVHPDDTEYVAERFFRLSQGMSVNDLEYRYRTKDGSYINILTNAGPICDLEGNVIAAFGIARNITHLKEMQKELADLSNELEKRVKERTAELEKANSAIKRSEEKYRLLLENANEGIGVAQEGMIKYFNPKVREIIGYSDDEILSKPFIEFIHPDDRAIARVHHMKRLEGDSPQSAYSIRVITKKGDVKLLEINGVKIYWEGKPATLNFLSDITESKMTKEALRISEDRYRKISELISDFVYSIRVEPDGTQVSEWATETLKRIMGISHDELLKGGWRDVIYPDDLPSLAERQQVLASGKPDVREYRIIKKAGEIAWVRDYGNPVWDEAQGRVVRIYGATQDITERKRAEEKLKESEEKYTALFERSNDAVYTCDFDGKFIDANPTALNMLGYTKDEIKFLEFSSLLSEDQLPLAYKALKEVIETGTQKGITEYRLKRKGGNFIWVESQGALVYKDGHPVAVQGIARNITERKNVEEALRESEEKFRNLAEKSPNMIFINQMGHVVYANEKCENVMGYAREELYSRDFNFMSIIAPESKEIVRINFAKHVQGEEVPPYEYSLLTKEGKRIEGILTTKIISYGGKQAILGIVTDITQRKRAEKALKESEELYSAVVENSEDGIIIIQGGKLTFANNSSKQLLGYPADEISGMNFLEFVAPHYRDMVKINYENRMGGGSVPNIYEILLLRKDGTTIPVEINATIIDYKGKPADLVFIRDLTERKRTEESLIHSEKLAGIGILSSGIAHEINNPLAGIMGYAEVIMDEENPELVKQYAKEIVKYTDRASDIVNWLSRYSRGAKDTDVVDVDLNEILSESVEAMKRARRIEGIKITTEYQKIPVIKGNRSELQQIFVNLLNNAIDALSSGGNVTLSTTADNDYVRVIVSDNGKGIPEGHIGRVFDPFFTTKKVGEGTGLGLYVTSMIVKKHYGQMDVESEVGKGTSFTIKFPNGKDLPQTSELKSVYKSGGNA